MDTKKIVLGIILVFILFGVILRVTFNRIVEVDIDVQISLMKDKTDFDVECQFLEHFYDQELFEGFSLNAFNIMVIDHSVKKILYFDGSAYEVKYTEFPESIRYGNSYYTMINGESTLIINNDKILGDVRSNIIVEGYKYAKMTVENLNPDNIEFYNMNNDKMELRFMRFKMIESLKKAIDNNSGLEEFKYYYETWKERYGDGYKDVTNYDIYEGQLEYIKIIVNHMLNNQDKEVMMISALEVVTWVDAYKFDSVYLKEDEYRLIGMMLYYYSEKNKGELILSLDKYLAGVPIRSVDLDNQEETLYCKLYNERIQLAYEASKKIDLEQADYSYQKLACEKYGHTYLLKDNYYIYSDYSARDKDGILLTYDYVIVKVEPYRLTYFMAE